MGQSPTSARTSGQFSDLRTRTISGIVLGALAVGFVYAGGIFVVILAGVAAIAMIVEWRSITLHGGKPCGVDVGVYLVAALGAFAMFYLVGLWAAALWLVVGALLGLISDVLSKRQAAGAWALSGTLYIGAASLALIALRGAEPYGFLSIIWAALVVVAADIGGYFAGRIFGGPKLWPAVSPKKTWSGLGGGVFLAFMVGGVFSWATTGTYFYQVCTVSSLAAVLAQGGDLAESAVKRRFGVKDASALIPGHGGVLDRLDGHMIAVLVACVITFSRGQAVFIW